MPHPEIVIEQGIVAGNVYDKYRTPNPIARRLMKGFLSAFDECVQLSHATSVHEVGCGEGELAWCLADLGLRVLASDFSSQIIRIAQESVGRSQGDSERINFKVADIHQLDPAMDCAELVVCCEVLEHLQRPADALRILGTIASKYLLVSVPREPLWRVLNMCRGKYLSAFGNTPGHLNHWSGRAFLGLLRQQGFRIVAVRSPLPWTMVLCRPPGA